MEQDSAAVDASRASLEEENRKLRKITRVLMDRVERDADSQGGNAFSLFQTAITLEGRVSERTAELTRLTHRLMHEISERRAIEEALRTAKIEAEEANLSKTKFLAAASHDLHQPLNAARLFLGALADEVQGTSGRELAERIEAALDTVSNMLNVLLEMSKLDARAWPTALLTFAVGPLLERLRREYQPQAEALGLELRLVPSSAVVYSDPHLFERVMRNLISNAIRYTSAGRVVIGCRRRQQGLRIEVWDTGIGIAESDRARIFGEFERLGKEPRRAEKGLGLGLAIVDRIARLLELEVGLRSQMGRGSCFSVLLPYGTSPPASGQSDTVTIAALPESLSTRCISVIENDAPTLEAISTLLESWDCEVVAAASSVAALGALERIGRTPDLIIADYQLDDELGTEAIARLRQRFDERIRALVISAQRSAGLASEVKRLGCAFLPKPIQPARLRAMTAFLLSRTEP
ncbi:MAG: response regulator [Acetobacteraceae bacterium]|nr:response regulator [Acetobacteraceae bacterium]